MYQDVVERIVASRKRSVQANNWKNTVQPINFGKGDFVLVRRTKHGAHKLAFKWISSRRIVNVNSGLVFKVRDLETGRTDDVYARRLLHYRVDMDGKDVDAALLDAARHLGQSYQVR